MKKRVRILAALLALTVSIAMLGGCKGNEGQDTSGENSTLESGKDGDPITLRFFCNEPVLDDKLKEICAEYTRRNPNINIEVIQSSAADYGTKVDTTIMSGEQLDICYFNTTQDYVARASQDEFLDLTEFIKDEGYSSINDLYTIDTTCEDGKVYALPGDVKPWFVWLNMEDLEKAGLEIPPLDWTWDDYEEYAKKLTWGEGTDRHYGSIMTTWQHFNILYTYNKLDGDPYLNDDGELRLDDPAFIESLKYRHKLEQEEKVSVPLADQLAADMDYRTAFFGGKCSMLLMGSNIVPQIADLENYPHTFQTTFAAMPRPADGREGVAYTDNRFYSIGKTTINAEEAYKFLRYFTTEGILEKGVSLAADKESEGEILETVDRMTETNPEMFDKEQLLKVMTNPDLKQNFWSDATAYTGEIAAAYDAVAQKAVMGEMAFDEAIETATKQCQQILDSKN